MFIAHVTFLGPGNGGRFVRPSSGYHPQVTVGSKYTSCVIESLSEETEFEFDKQYRVRLRLFYPEIYHGWFAPGGAVQFYEGSHLVGYGTILEVE